MLIDGLSRCGVSFHCEWRLRQSTTTTTNVCVQPADWLSVAGIEGWGSLEEEAEAACGYIKGDFCIARKACVCCPDTAVLAKRRLNCSSNHKTRSKVRVWGRGWVGMNNYEKPGKPRLHSPVNDRPSEGGQQVTIDFVYKN